MPPEDPYGPHNTTPEGDYIVGKGRPPDSGKFRKGDGRPRGRRPKGTRNLATDFREELDGRVPVTVGGVTNKVTRQQAVVKRLTDNALKGQNTAIVAVLDYEQRLVAPLRRREEERKQVEEQPDCSCLSVQELRALEFLSLKSRGLPTSETNIARVIPIYEEPGSASSGTDAESSSTETEAREAPHPGADGPEAGPDQT